MNTPNPVDAALLVGAAMRLTHFVTHDDLPGTWWIKEPLWRKAGFDSTRLGREVKWVRYLQGLDCPHCVGQWISAGVLASYLATTHTPRGRAVWRAVAGALTLNVAAVSVGSVTDYWERHG